MTFAARATASTHRMVKRMGAGAQVTIRRQVRLISPATGGSISTLAVVGVTALGASTITLDAVSMKGTLPTGATFTIAGDATTYTTTNAKTAASNALTGVTFSPVLAAQAANDAVVTITGFTVDYTFYAAIQSYQERDIDGTSIQVGDREVILSALAPATTPVQDDGIIINGEVFSILAVRPLQPGSVVAAWRVQVGRR